MVFVRLFGASVLVKRKDSDYKYKPFFEQAKKGNIDVLFMGSSHVINGINPVKLYKDYGYTSYNMGGHGSVMQATYWELMEALEYCTPKWVVVDTYMLEKNYQYLDEMDETADESLRNTSVEQLHLNMDVWPLDKLKVTAIEDLIADKDIRNQFLFDFIVYHDRWNELTDNDYRALKGQQDVTYLLGAEMRKEVDYSPVFSADPSEGEELSEWTVGQEYLTKILEECEAREIGVLLINLPYCATTEDKIAANSAGILANMYDVPYINMLNMDIINIYSDLNDAGHLNVSGANKVTASIGKWLMENGDLTDHRGNADYVYFDECVEKYVQQIPQDIQDVQDLYSELSVASLDDVSCVVYFNQGSQALKDDNIKRLVEGITGTDKIYQVNEPYICIKDSASGNIYEAGDGEMIENAATAMGNLTYQPVEAMFRFLYVDDNLNDNYLYDDEHLAYDIQIITYDKDTGEVLSHKYYRSFGNKYRAD